MKIQDSMTNSNKGSSELFELRKISKILLISNAKAIELELTKYINTEERKKIWILIDGERTVNDLINMGNMKQRTIYDFLKILEIADLIEFPHGKPPKKILDFIPASWLSLINLKEVDKESSSDENEKTISQNTQGDLGVWVK